MKINSIVAVLCFFFLAGCSTTMQKQSSGSISIASTDYDKVFSSVVQAAIDSGLVVAKAEKENGFILATSSHNPFVTYNAPAINILLNKADSAVNVTIKSTVHGQIADYGTSRNNVVKFCKSLQTTYPSSGCKIQ